MNQQPGTKVAAREWIERFWAAIEAPLKALFLPGESRLYTWAGRAVLLGLFSLGAAHWAYFLNYGRITFDMHDWVQEGWRYTVLQQAVLTGRLPLHVSTPFSSLERFIARPDTVLSPQVLLLRNLDLGQFVLANTLLLYSAGFAGLLWLRRRYNLSLAPFTALFLLFNFNGHITAHLAVGHSMYAGYFLLPFFVYLVLKLLEDGGAGWAWVTQLAVLLFVLFLQGAFHQFLWCLMFLAALALFQPRYAAPLLKGIFFSILLSLPRILPPALEFAGEGMNFISGFPTLADLLAGLVVLKHPVEALSNPASALGWWEIDHYVGLVGLVFLCYFGLYLTWKSASEQRAVLAPSAVLALLSVGHIYYLINRLPLPLTDSERVSSRFLILPLVFLFVLGALRFESYLRERGVPGARTSLLYLGGLVVLGHDLLQHSRLWRFTNMYQLFPNTPVQMLAELVQRSDPPYFLSLAGGAGLALLGLIYLLVRARQETTPLKSAEQAQPPA
jgi:hypothetical protein